MALFELLVNAIRVRKNALPWTRARTGTSTENVVPATPWRMIPARSATAASSAKTAGAMHKRTPTATWTRRRRFMSVFLLLEAHRYSYGPHAVGSLAKPDPCLFHGYRRPGIGANV